MHLAIITAAALSLAAEPRLPSASGLGVHIASVKLCRDAVVGADWKNTKAGPRLTLNLAKPASEAIQQRTRALVGKSLPVTLDGRMLLEVYVLEPLTSSSLQLALGMSEAGEMMSAISKSPCPR